MEALIGLLSTCSTYSNLNLSSPVACPCRAVSSPLQYIGFLCPFSQNPIHTVPPLSSFLLLSFLLFLLLSLGTVGSSTLWAFVKGSCPSFPPTSDPHSTLKSNWDQRKRFLEKRAPPSGKMEAAPRCHGNQKAFPTPHRELLHWPLSSRFRLRHQKRPTRGRLSGPCWGISGCDTSLFLFCPRGKPAALDPTSRGHRGVDGAVSESRGRRIEGGGEPRIFPRAVLGRRRAGLLDWGGSSFSSQQFRSPERAEGDSLGLQPRGP